jgi:coproporphyrinogen III oxidase-like Fe-S oxidoreductase
VFQRYGDSNSPPPFWRSRISTRASEQEIINRIQPYERVEQVTPAARDIGYESINFDLVHGLPLQRPQSVIDTVRLVKRLRPDRIAYDDYAHLPWIRGIGQRKFSEDDLPRGTEKLKLYEIGRRLLEEAGYPEIGTDHFALESDALFQAAAGNALHRNFMGYTPRSTPSPPSARAYGRSAIHGTRSPTTRGKSTSTRGASRQGPCRISGLIS